MSWESITAIPEFLLNKKTSSYYLPLPNTPLLQSKTPVYSKKTVNESNKLDTIISNITDGVLVLDQYNRLVKINEMARQALGTNENVKSGTTVEEIIEDQELLAMLKDFDSKLNNHIEITSNDDHIFNAQMTPIPDVGIALTLSDITYLKKIRPHKKRLCKCCFS